MYKSLIILILSMSVLNAQEKDNVLFYFGDPMCSWCYGFSEELSQIKDSIPSNVDFEMVMGGLRPFGTEKINEMKGFLKEHWEQVNEASGLEFNYEILDSADWNYDTEPPSRSTVIVLDMDENIAFDFFKDVQRMFYYENLNPSLVESYFHLLKKYDLDKDEFIEKFNSEEYKTKTLEQFEITKQFGVRGFPSLVLKKGDKYYLLANGYNTSANILPAIDKILNESK